MPPSPNSNANPKPNPDPDRGQFSRHRYTHVLLSLVCSISEGTVSNEQNVELVLHFNAVRDNTPAALTPRFVPLNDEREIPRKDYCNAVKKSAPVSVSPQEVFPSNNVTRARNGSIKNDPYPVQPLVRRKTKRTAKPNLLAVGDSHIKHVEKDLIVHHMNNKNISLKCKNFDGADVRKIQHHLLPSLHGRSTRWYYHS